MAGRESTTTSRSTRSGCSAASAIALAPPIECPTTVIRSHPSSSMIPTRSATKSSVAYAGGSGHALSP
jgi:hypothetical protein